MPVDKQDMIGGETETSTAMRMRDIDMTNRANGRVSGATALAIAAMASVAIAGFTPSSATAQTPGADGKSKPAAKAPAATGGVGAAAAVGEAGLKARVESLEEQLVDMQVVVGTLESLAKSGGGASPGPSFRPSTAGGADATRIDSLETQIRQLSTQVQALSDQLRNTGAPLRRSEATEPGFGATTVTPGEDSIGGLLAGDGPPPGSGAAPGDGSSAVATGALAAANDGVEPKQLYETAYGYLLQRDYGAAESAFGDFLQRFPSDSLSGNAQFWLGESLFVRGQYKAAAGAFLKGYQTYAQSQKAPDSLLKLAMSLDRLGQKDAACSSFAELNVKFPNAAQSIKARAQSERQRVGCS